jgi:GlpG protein
MRKIGTLPTSALAHQFQRYLSSRKIENRIDPIASGWEIWIISEDHVQAGRDSLTAFQAQPEAPEFAAPASAEAPSPVRRPPRRRARIKSTRRPLTAALLIASSIISFATRFGERPVTKLFDLLLFSPAVYIGYGPVEIEHGEIWRIYTPMFLHLSLIHLGMNMAVLWTLGGAIEQVQGTWRLLWLILAIAPVSHFTEYCVTGGHFGGMSGVLYGLFGYVWMRSWLLPRDGFVMPRQVVTQIIIWTVICLSGAMGPVANGAHLGGLAAGLALGAFPRLWRTAWS